MNIELLAHIAIFTTLFIVVFYLLKNIKYVLLIILTGFIAIHVSNYIHYDKKFNFDMAINIISKIEKNLTGLNNKINELTDKEIEKNEPYQKELLKKQHEKLEKIRNRTLIYQQELNDKKKYKYMMNKYYINKIRNY